MSPAPTPPVFWSLMVLANPPWLASDVHGDDDVNDDDDDGSSSRCILRHLPERRVDASGMVVCYRTPTLE